MKRFGRMVGLPTAGIVLLVLLAACGATANPGTLGSSGTTTTPQTATPTAPSATQPSGVFVPGTIAFSGTVQQVSQNSITVRMPDGHDVVMAVAAGQTDLSGCDDALPHTGQQITAHASADHDGHFTANSLAFTDMQHDHNSAQVEYHGVTTSAVGADRMLHFKVGTTAYSFPMSPTCDLHDFSEHGQTIGAGQQVDVHVQFQGASGAVVEVEHWDGH